MNLTVIDHQAIQALPVSLQPFAQLRQETPIKNISESVVKKACLDIVTLAHFDSGTTLPGEVHSASKLLEFQTTALLNELTGRYKDLTISEIKDAFKRGIRGEAGQFFGLCAKTYHQFLKWYFEHPDRTKAQTLYLAEIDKATKSDKPVQFTPEYLKNASLKAFEDYQMNLKMPMVPHAIYDTIKELQGVKSLMAESEWPEILKEAKETFQASQQVGRTRKVTKAELDLSMSNRAFEFHVKKIGLRRYFDSLIANNKTLEI